MNHRCIRYRLAHDGQVPYFLCLHPEGVGGRYAVADPSTPSPRDTVMIGISENEDTGDAEVIPTQADLEAYLRSVGTGWGMPDPARPGDPTAMLPFDPAAAAADVWARLTALNT